MNFTIKEKINNTIQQLDNQYKKFREELDSITKLTIYTDEEKNRRIREIKTKYQNGAKTTTGNLKKCVESWIDSDIQKIHEAGKKEKNVIYMMADLYSLNIGKYDDKDSFMFLQKYFGDIEAMKRFSGVPRLVENKGVTFWMLKKAAKVDSIVTEIIERFNKYLDSYQKFYSCGTDYISSLLYSDYLLNSVNELCSTLEIIERLKTAKYEDAKNWI